MHAPLAATSLLALAAMPDPPVTCEDAWKQCIDEVLLDEPKIEARLDELASTIPASRTRASPARRATRAAPAGAIAANYRGLERPLVVVPVLKGGVHTGVALSSRLGRLGVPCRLDFLWLASYCGTKSAGTARMLADLQTKIAGERVLLVDDLIDTGLTLATAAAHLRAKGPATLEICVLLEKLGVARHATAEDVAVDYLGFTIPNKFVVGLCNDYSEQFRNHAAVCSVKKDKLHLLEAKKCAYERAPDGGDAAWRPPADVDPASLATYVVANRVYCSWALKGNEVTPPPTPPLAAAKNFPSFESLALAAEALAPPRQVTPPL